VEVTHELRARAATGLLLPGAVASGRTAAALWDVPLAGRDDDVELTVPTMCRARAVEGLQLTRRALDEADVTGRRGVPVTSPLRTAVDLARISPLEEAVVALDRFLAPGLVFLDDVRAAAATVTGRHCRHIRTAAERADGLAGSPQETRLRLLLHRSALPRPVAQYSVRVDSAFVARVDFAWPDHRLAVEYEGLWHGEHQHVVRDRTRLNALTRAGWRVVFVTAADLRDPERLIARIAEALAASRFA
jgi:very-short-patch-repair endonuclease